jgi:hypothetical protein
MSYYDHLRLPEKVLRGRNSRQARLANTNWQLMADVGTIPHPSYAEKQKVDG